MSKVLVISHDVIGRQMAGPGIRYWELSKALAAKHDVALACPNQPDITSPELRLTPYERGTPESLRSEIAQTQVLVVCGDTLERFPGILKVGKPIVVDLYDPFILENLEMNRGLSLADQQARQESGLSVLQGLLQAGDFFVCANDRQRDFWLGMLAASGRLTPEVYSLGASLDALIAVVPFGVPSRTPVKRQTVLKGKWPGIGPSDKVVLWGGGLWDWLDPVTAVRAVHWLAGKRNDVRLFFLGTRHPNYIAVPEMKVASEARHLSQELHLLDTHVFFNDWTAYDERADYLLEADVGISLHRDLVETRFSSRTRLLDYFWAGLPMVITGGDPLSETVKAKKLGLLVDFGDAEGTGKALLELIEREGLKQELEDRFAAVRSSLSWQSSCDPLIRFCDRPRFTAPRATPPQASSSRGTMLSRALARLTGTSTKSSAG